MAASCAAAMAQSESALSCADLANLKIEGVEITQAAPIPAGTTVPPMYPGAPGSGALPAHCRVDGIRRQRSVVLAARYARILQVPRRCQQRCGQGGRVEPDVPRARDAPLRRRARTRPVRHAQCSVEPGRERYSPGLGHFNRTGVSGTNPAAVPRSQTRPAHRTGRPERRSQFQVSVRAAEKSLNIRSTNFFSARVTVL